MLYPKWTETYESGAKRTKINESDAYSSSSNAESTASEHTSTSPMRTRPMGLNAAKKKEKVKFKGTPSISKDELDKEKMKVIEEFNAT